jgi:hypothetical protein
MSLTSNTITIDETTTKQSIGMWCKVVAENEHMIVVTPIQQTPMHTPQKEPNEYLDSLTVAELKQLSSMNPVESIHRQLRGIKRRSSSFF